MSLIPFHRSKLDKLDLTPPPAELFEELLGYSGERRWVGFFYRDGCLYFTSGERVEAGNWQPWVLWHWSLDHEVISQYFFGYDDGDAQHMLVLDRKSRTFYGGKMEIAREVLRQQIPPAQPTESLHLSREELERLKDGLKERLLCMSVQEYRNQREKLDSGLERLETLLGGNLLRDARGHSV